MRMFWCAPLLLCAVSLGCGSAVSATEKEPRGSDSDCVTCHLTVNPGTVEQWKRSAHAASDVGCVDCHRAGQNEADAFNHEGTWIAVVNTPRDCGRCHEAEWHQFDRSQHARAAAYTGPEAALAVVPPGAAESFPAFSDGGVTVHGGAAADSGCAQCHGSKMALVAKDGSLITVDELDPDDHGVPRNPDALAAIQRHADGAPVLDAGGWPNTGVGRINLDGSRGSCSACHSRHDFSRRRARRPDNCGKCHEGPGHGQAQVYQHSKHGIAFRDTKNNLVDLNLKMGRKQWWVGRDYSDAPTCATCHMSGHARNEGKITHDPRTRLYWNNQGPISRPVHTDGDGELVDSAEGAAGKADDNRDRMKSVCRNCHSANYVNGFFRQYDALVVLYNEKFAMPAAAILAEMREGGLLTETPFDEQLEWSWFRLWHDAGRQLRYGAAMMSPGHTQWRGMRELIETFYVDFIAQARARIERAKSDGDAAGAEAAGKLIDEILARPEHRWQNGAHK